MLYNLDREAAFDLNDATTPQAVGKILAQELQQAQHFDDETLAEQMKVFTNPTERFYYYAQLHGWTDLISEATRCFDLNSDETASDWEHTTCAPPSTVSAAYWATNPPTCFLTAHS